VGRISNFDNFLDTNKKQENSVICLEYWSNDDDDLWSKNSDEIIELAKSEVTKTGLVIQDDIISGKVIKIPKCYPIYQIGYKQSVEKIKNYLNSINNLHVIGRYGSFKYNNQDHSILMGLLAANNINNDKKIHNLWEINSDYEYQETSLITSTGLKKS